MRGREGKVEARGRTGGSCICGWRRGRRGGGAWAAGWCRTAGGAGGQRGRERGKLRRGGRRGRRRGGRGRLGRERRRGGRGRREEAVAVDGVLLPADVARAVESVLNDVEVPIVEGVASDDDHAHPEPEEDEEEEHIAAAALLGDWLPQGGGARENLGQGQCQPEGPGNRRESGSAPP